MSRQKTGFWVLVLGFLLIPGGIRAQQEKPLPPINPSSSGLSIPQGQGACSVEKICADLAPDMIRRATGPSPLEQNLRNLTDKIGGRLTGSLAADKAVLWALEAFRRERVDEVHLETFTVPMGWQEGLTRLDLLSSDTFPVHLVSIGWSPATPPGGITADIVDAGTGSGADFSRLGTRARGALLLIHTGFLSTWEQLLEEYMQDPSIIERAVQSRAAAILWMSTRPNMLLYRHNNSLDGKLERLPQAIVAREDAERITRLLASGEAMRARLLMPNRAGGPVKSQNVVAEIRGRELPGEFVLLGAHLDSWELGTGALDNGCNAALVIDAARVILASGVRPRRSIRFVLFTGEEQGMLGSWAYARQHRAELDRMNAAIIFDAGTGRVTGYSLGGRKDIAPAVNELLEAAKPLGELVQTNDAEMGTDNFDFLLEGVPTLVANQEPSNYMLNYHAFSDTFDKVDMAQLKKHVALAAITAFGIADRDARLGKRQSRNEIEALIKDTGLAEQMRKTGFLPMWQSGERGREPADR